MPDLWVDGFSENSAAAGLHHPPPGAPFIRCHKGTEVTEEIFLTGATGFIGSSLLQKWLDSSDARLNLLVRRRREESPRQRIERALGELYPHSDSSRFSKRMEVIEGDVSRPEFGLSGEEYESLAGRTSHIIHCAAAARFDLELRDARNTNVQGTKNVLAFARRCKGLKMTEYIGTAYVAGRRKGIVKEGELDKGQQHNNSYEVSKLEAEKLVRDSMPELPIAILRPSIVICDSRTGRASSHNGFYRILRMYSLGHLKMLPGDSSSLLDLVPVDYVAEAAYSISTSTNSPGRCYHLTAGLENPTTLGQIRDLASCHFHREKFALIPPEEFDSRLSKMYDKLNEDERNMIDEVKLYMPYIASGLRFDNSNTITETGLPVPKVSGYFGKMAEYIIKHTGS